MRHAQELDLNSFKIFIAVAQAGGFTAASERLGVAKSRVSLQISRLEAALGVALFNRTTRQVSLTEAGACLLAECAPLLSGIQEAIDRVGHEGAELSGTLRIAAPVDFAVQSLAPVVTAFAGYHPALHLELRSSDRIVDAVKEGIDVAFRVGWLRDSSQRAVKLHDFEQYLVAAPQYLEKAGIPAEPAQLVQHRWLALTLMRSPLSWSFSTADGICEQVQMHSALRVDSATLLRALLVQGAGISVLDQPSAAPELAAGRLVRLLEHWSLPSGGVYAVFPPGHYVSAKARAFVDLCRELLPWEAGA